MRKKSLEELREFTGRTLGVKDLGPDPGMGRVRGWDSLAHVNLILAIEEWAGVSVPPELMGELATLEAIASYLREQGGLAG